MWHVGFVALSAAVEEAHARMAMAFRIAGMILNISFHLNQRRIVLKRKSQAKAKKDTTLKTPVHFCVEITAMNTMIMWHVDFVAWSAAVEEVNALMAMAFRIAVVILKRSFHLNLSEWIK